MISIKPAIAQYKCEACYNNYEWKQLDSSVNDSVQHYNHPNAMAATSGIGVSPELTKAFSDAVETKNVRFIKVIIQDGLC
jgi:hypothetical protein